MLLQIAINGARDKKENEFLPHSLTEIESEVKSLYKKNFTNFHIHCYDKKENESIKPEDVNNLVSLIRIIGNDIELGISTGEWIEPDTSKRIKNIKGWKNLPDFASVNFIEVDAVRVAEVLVSKGIKIEAGLNEQKAAEIFVKSNLEKYCCRILIEPEEDNLEDAMKTVSEIEEVLDSNKVKVKRLLHGFNMVTWKILKEAKAKGYDSRVGMEDVIFLENGKKVKSNLEIAEEASRILYA